MNRRVLLIVLFVAGAIVVGANIMRKNQAPRPTSTKIVDKELSAEEAENLPLVSEYRQKRSPGTPYSLLPVDGSQQKALAVFRSTSQWQELAAAAKKDNHLVELFSVVEPQRGDVPVSQCPQIADCQRIEYYNFSLNSLTSAYVNTATGKLVGFGQQVDVQPDIPDHLVEVAQAISAGSSAVDEERSKYSSVASEPVMSSTKTNMAETRCERQRHLCVAPTYPASGGAVWAIVDLTELRVAAVAWTRLGMDYDQEQPLTLRRAEKQAIDEFCKQSHSFSKGDWTGDYQLTSSDGLQVTNLKFKDELVAQSIKLVDWHVNYSGRHQFGYSDAIGCPAFSQAAVVAADVPFWSQNDSAALLNQDFWSDNWPAACNYYYRQSLELRADGSFKPIAQSRGRGCGDDGTYRPTWRIHLPAGSSVAGKSTEFWDEGGSYDFGDYSLETNPEKDGNVFVYATSYKPDIEGDGELPTLGSCCNTDYKQGPEQFVDGEDLSGDGLVLWHVASMKNSFAPGKEACWAETVINNDGLAENKVKPCSSGPLFERQG